MGGSSSKGKYGYMDENGANRASPENEDDQMYQARRAEVLGLSLEDARRFSKYSLRDAKMLSKLKHPTTGGLQI